MFGNNPELSFKASIRRGASIGQDFRFYRWPRCAAPGGKHEADDADMVFDCMLDEGHTVFDLKAPGYGGKPYGNGSIGVWRLTDLNVSEADRAKVIQHMTAKKQAQIEKASADLIKLHAEMAAMTTGNCER